MLYIQLNAQSIQRERLFPEVPFLSLFVAQMLKLYSATCNDTVLPNTFVMPRADYIGMASAASETYAIGPSKLEYLLKAFKEICGPDFKILNTAYGNKTQLNANTGNNYYRYILYRDDPETLEMNIPVAYTSTAMGTPNGFDFENVAMGQFSGVFAKRPQEIYYLDDDATS